MKLVIYPPIDPARLAKIRAAASPMAVATPQDDAEAAREIADADAFFGKLTPELLAAARQLHWVQAPTASLEHYLFPALIEHACVLTNMRGLYSDVVADHAFAFVLCFARNFPRYIRQQLAAHWEAAGDESQRSDFVHGPGVTSAVDRAHLHLGDCTLGVIGLGGIGLAIAERGAAFGMRVVAVDPQPKPGVLTVAAVWPPEELSQLLAESDFVVCAAPHTPATQKLFRRAQFAQMKRTAYFINIGRGAIVDLADLTQALDEGLLAGAGLDVFEVEPLPPDHPLWRRENVMITPHVAGTSPRIAERHLSVVLENAAAFAAGQPLKNVVDKRVWY